MTRTLVCGTYTYDSYSFQAHAIACYRGNSSSGDSSEPNRDCHSLFIRNKSFYNQIRTALRTVADNLEIRDACASFTAKYLYI